MSEENGNKEVVDLKKAVEEGVSEKITEYTDAEKKAMEDGWIPPDRFNSEEQGKTFISAEKFLENGSFFKKINDQKSKIEQLENSINQLNSHYQKVAENERKKAQKEYKEEIDRLKTEKVKALEDGDNQRVVDIDEELRDKKEPEKGDPQFEQFFKEWAEKNKWYDDDRAMRDYADMLGDGYAARHQETPYQQIFEFVTEEVKQRYPDKFKNNKREKAPTVEGTPSNNVSDQNTALSNKGDPSIKDLTTDEKTIFKNFERMKIFKTDKDRTKYIKEVVELRS